MDGRCCPVADSPGIASGCICALAGGTGLGRTAVAAGDVWLAGLDIHSPLCEILGHPEEELQGRRFRCITYPEDYEPDESKYRRLMSAGFGSYTLEKLAEVQRSNQDLQQFAYVASHDLQEPLRMVSSYMQLLDRKYREQLDEKAQRYIYHAVDGTKRMQDLIEGLLRYSRIIRDDKLAPVDTNAAYAVAIANLAQAIGEAGGEVTADRLPIVEGDEIQLVQLFQNLIGNSLKYRKASTSVNVHVSARQEGGEWIFSIKDNGIGIPPEHFDKVFHIFQRLHTRDEYPGTGIGLASCKKIVERHNGRIWVESALGEGSTFYFGIPSG